MSVATEQLHVKTPHVSVMAAQTWEGLALRQGAWCVDGTFGAGGHARLLLGRGVNVAAIDQDPAALDYATAIGAEALPGELRFAAGNFRDMEGLVAALGVDEVHGVLLDLGVSSMQLDEGDRGFAFRKDGPLDMRMGTEGPSAADVVNDYSFEDLAAIIFRFGEERHSRRVARRIVEGREASKITTTSRLAELVSSAYPPGPRREHPARRTFQALRIYVNDELGALQEGLEAAARLLEPAGRLVVLSYHSLEDRIVKQFLKDSPRMAPVHKRPLEPTPEEIEANPRARSAKLRVGEKVAP
ncbi:MAG: 16S rRNA (cytosine(1402)-N(4))-methyltransferase RsmH [Trueperaceae bacterium]|jgi:16S rRNA (cytosine1402-N4)-methyltransferase|nr:16S rRNA (cytosine(1402)-N(4))-methyltransferase RsmH [Truepera sp.]HRN19209.1 16S rRNA (cytosine(1402)-N(4))-methyltransferase RsmH [Trueperaceae bacterium]HRQ11621.1 16S rRNA (cytosine(1402)-N(4))-methyltransferase RsmH [Trueperaceae bacterium]